MRILDRYIMKEITGPLALGFLAYTFILMMQFLFRSAEMIIRRGVPAEQVGELLWLSIPNIVVLTIPMAQLFAILVSVGRLSTESELTAMRASGVSLFSLYRPILLLSLILTGVNMFLMVSVLPRGNSRLQALNIEILTSSVRFFHVLSPPRFEIIATPCMSAAHTAIIRLNWLTIVRFQTSSVRRVAAGSTSPLTCPRRLFGPKTSRQSVTFN